ncbi:MAG: 4-(cytidine 5'-diphospho)-2-C-methyl-D-erythritol kinase [Gemmatimonadales bacterium]
MSESVVLDAQAKVNLFLRVLATETSGYHGVETLFCRIALADRLEVRRLDEPGQVALEVRGAELGDPKQNLAYRAAQAVLDATGRRFGVAIELEKRIPMAAGLGGGSADAAATLAAVNRLAGNAVPRAELAHLASRLGADVPFALSEAPLALGWGHGERLLRLPPLPKAPGLLLVPPVGVATADAYRWLDAAREGASPRGAVTYDLDVLSRWSDIARLAGNDFESVIFARTPAVREGFDALARTQPMLCRMSGSGSTLFAVYRSARDRDDAQAMLGKKHGRVIATELG